MYLIAYYPKVTPKMYEKINALVAVEVGAGGWGLLLTFFIVATAEKIKPRGLNLNNNNICRSVVSGIHVTWPTVPNLILFYDKN